MKITDRVAFWMHSDPLGVGLLVIAILVGAYTLGCWLW